jgi:8-oxo-dGTP pyrophosphatase MutT (NUDIX family)
LIAWRVRSARRGELSAPNMVEKRTKQAIDRAEVRTLDQVSAGGVAFRWRDSEPEMVIISVKPSLRWQLPKGIVDPGESPEMTAGREVREEAGIETELIALIETIEYWYRAVRNGKPVRYHKFVHFHLLRYLSGNVSDHDHEVAEARWVSFDEASEMLAFESERGVAEKALTMILAMTRK